VLLPASYTTHEREPLHGAAQSASATAKATTVEASHGPAAEATPHATVEAAAYRATSKASTGNSHMTACDALPESAEARRSCPRLMRKRRQASTAASGIEEMAVPTMPMPVTETIVGRIAHTPG